jgi:hypothetical protein
LVSIAHHGAADDVIMRAIGAELRRVRDHLGWTRAAVVDRMPSTNGSTIVRMERALLEEMAAFFGFTTAEFVKHVTRFMPESAPPGTRANRNGQTHDQR